MENLEQKIKLWGPTGLTETTPDEAEVLMTSGYRPATEEEIKFSSTPETIKGVGEAVGRGLGGVFFTAAERALGVDKESIANREKISVGETLAPAIEFGTMLAPMGIIGKAAKLTEAGQAVSPLLKAAETVSKFTFPGALDVAGNVASRGIEGAAAKLAMKYGVENALYSVSDDFGKKLISNKPEDVHEVLSGALAHAALSGIVGAGLGYGVGKLSPLWKTKEGAKVANAIDQIKADTNPLPPTAAPAAEEKLAAEIIPEEPLKKPTTYEEYLEQGKKLKEVTLPEIETPDEIALRDASERLGNKVKTPVDELQLEALKNTEARRRIEILKGQDPALAEVMEKRAQVQRYEAEQGIRQNLERLSPSPATDEIVAGKKHVENLSEAIYKVEEENSKQWKRFNDLVMNPLATQVDFTGRLERIDPKIRNYFKVNNDGLLKLLPYDALEVGMTEQTYNKLKKIEGIFNKKDLTIRNIWNARKTMAPLFKTEELATRKESIQIQRALMDMMEESVKKIDPSFETKKMFQDYAVMRDNIDQLERFLGTSLDKKGELVNPEEVMKRLMKSSETVDFLKTILPKKQFDEFLGDFLSLNMQKVTKEGVKEGFLSTRRFGKFLKDNDAKLKAAFGENQAILQEIKDWNTLATIVPDMAKVNVSESGVFAARAIKEELAKNYETLKNVVSSGSLSAAAINAARKMGEAVMRRVEETATQKQVEQMVTSLLQGQEKQAGAASLLRTIKDWTKSTNAAGFEALRQYLGAATKGTYLITKEIKTIFDPEKPAQPEKPDIKKLDRLDKKLQALGSKPEDLLNVGGEIGYYAPEHATAIGTVSARVVNYLNQKRPTPKKNGPLDREIPPSKAQLNNYYRTLNLAENPTVILQRIKNGTIHSRDVVDLKNIYPELYDSFLMKLSNELLEAQTKGKQLPFSIKKGLSIYSGSPLDSTMTPQSIQAAQATYQPQQQPQSALPQMAKKSSRKSQLPSLTETDQQRRMLKQ
jgi:hypothetical protein